MQAGVASQPQWRACLLWRVLRVHVHSNTSRCGCKSVRCTAVEAPGSSCIFKTSAGVKALGRPSSCVVLQRRRMQQRRRRPPSTETRRTAAAAAASQMKTQVKTRRWEMRWIQWRERGRRRRRCGQEPRQLSAAGLPVPLAQVRVTSCLDVVCKANCSRFRWRGQWQWRTVWSGVGSSSAAVLVWRPTIDSNRAGTFGMATHHRQQTSSRPWNGQQESYMRCTT